MKGLQDAFWRDTAAELALECFDHEGEPVARARATRDDTLRGDVDGHAVSLSYGLGSHGEKVTVIEVRAQRPLLLGLEIRSMAAGRDGRGRPTYPERTSVEGIDRAHVDTLFATPPRGREIVAIMQRFGKLGWALLDDTHLRAQLEAEATASDGWTKLTRLAVRAMRLAEEASEAGGPSPWAARVLAAMVPAAAPLDLQVDAATLAIRGRYRDCPIALTAEQTKHGYTFVCSAELPKHVKKRARVERRTGFLDRALASLGIGTGGADRALERAFRISGPTEWISPDVVTALLSAPAQIETRIEERTLTLRAPIDGAEVAELLRIAVGVVGGITGPMGAPYR